MIATLQKSEGSLWHTQGLYFDGLRTKAIILSFSTIKRLYGQIRGQEEFAKVITAGSFLRFKVAHATN